MLDFATMMLPQRVFRFLPLLLGGVTLSLALAQGGLGDMRARLQPLLPDHLQSADVMNWVPDAEVAAIKERIRQASRQDPRWFRDYAAEHSGESVLPWHPKFNVSESEYQRALSPDWVSVQKMGKSARLYMAKTSERVTFQGGPGAEVLRGLSLDLNTGELRTPDGFVARPKAVNVPAVADTTGLGARRGWGWHIESVNLVTKTAVIANFNLLQLSSGAVVLAYNRGSTVDRKLQPQINLTLMYEKKSGVSKR